MGQGQFVTKLVNEKAARYHFASTSSLIPATPSCGKTRFFVKFGTRSDTSLGEELRVVELPRGGRSWVLRSVEVTSKVFLVLKRLPYVETWTLFSQVRKWLALREQGTVLQDAIDASGNEAGDVPTEDVLCCPFYSIVKTPEIDYFSLVVEGAELEVLEVPFHSINTQVKKLVCVPKKKYERRSSTLLLAQVISVEVTHLPGESRKELVNIMEANEPRANFMNKHKLMSPSNLRGHQLCQKV